MKSQNLHIVSLFVIVVIALTFSSANTFGQSYVKNFNDERVLWEPFWPWDSSVLQNDSLRVNISDSFTNSEKDSIRAAMNKWNAEGGQPPMRENGPTAPVKVEKGSLPAGTPGKTEQKDSDKDGKAESATVTLDPSQCTTISLKEVATHEFGHVLGLGHTNGAADVMKPVGTNGTNGNLSDHDKSELKTVNSQYSVSLPRDGAELPTMALFPGDTALLGFDVSAYYPPEILPLVMGDALPFFDENMFVLGTFIDNHMLEVEVFPTINHWYGTFYLIINLLPPEPYEPVSFLGYFYISENPVPRISFECPFNVYEENGWVHVDWTELCTYPFQNELNSLLIVDESIKASPKDGQNYVLELDPGPHTFELFVDDFQVNQAYFSLVYLVTGIKDAVEAPFSMEVTPNPFNESCTIRSDNELQVGIFDATGRLVESLSGRTVKWTPEPGMDPGLYYIQASDGKNKLVRKVIFTR